MRPRLANPAGARCAGAYDGFAEPCQPLPPPLSPPLSPPADHRRPAAPAASSSPAGAAAVVRDMELVPVSEATAFVLRLVCAHQGREPQDILAALVAAAGEAIGLSPLLAGREVDLADLPDFARTAARSFRSGGS